MEPGTFVTLESPFRVHIRAVKRETQFGEALTSETLETAWETVEKVKKAHPDAEISVEIEV